MDVLNSPSTSGVAKSLKVLVVDDEQVIADTLAQIIRQAGHAAHAVYTGEAAFVLAQEVNPDVVISDVIMGQMTGLDLAMLLIQRQPGCKILLISGNENAGALVSLAHARGFSFPLLAKPSHPSEILEFLTACAC